ncbi:MAG TPA: 16S rRNA (guanine(966)-N(2))-methyltransferase RsmD [Gemmatimonadota bacterium]|nr:16S rRNA (guanine(966)-N(2))-methyltransferase RsmD [Gemmatimonadota bacterium]
MRVVAGRLGGRRLRAPRGAALRPTSDRVRESIFGILGDTVLGARVLDLYAGTGAMAIEAQSRGAAEAVCVETDTAALRALERNLAELGLAGTTRVVRARALDFCRRMPEDGSRFDVVFCDPPYRDDPAPIIDVITTSDWWNRVWVLEHAARRTVSAPPEGTETRRWGDTAATFFWRS